MTTISIITAGPSSSMPTSISTPPFSNQVQACVTGCDLRTPPPRPPASPDAATSSVWAVAASCSASSTWRYQLTWTTSASTNARPTAAMPISLPLRGSRFPKNRIRKKLAAGMSGMIQA